MEAKHVTALHFIVNPTANSGAAEATWQQCQAYLADHQLTYTADLTHHVGDAKQFAQTFITHHPNFSGKLIVVGGDGTVSEVLTGLAQRPDPLPVGIVPAGKNNWWAQRSGLPLNVTSALTSCLTATTPHPVAVGKFRANARGTQPAYNGYFVNQLSIGLLTHIKEIAQAYAASTPHGWREWLKHNWLTHWFERTNAYMSQEQFNVGIRADTTQLLWQHAYQLYVVPHSNVLEHLRLKATPAAEQLSLIVLRRNNIVSRTFLKIARLCGLAHRLPLVKQINAATINLSINALEFGACDGHPLGNKFFTLTLSYTTYPIW